MREQGISAATSMSAPGSIRTGLRRFNENQLRLRVGYGQLDDAEAAVYEKYYLGAIFHLRTARAYGISILEHLADKPDEREALKNKYRVIKADNLNRIFAEKGVKREDKR